MAALSLQCKDCGAQLRSVAEAQSHGEATGTESLAFLVVLYAIRRR